ncbi:MAG: hypothetical protein OEQ53_01980 [Saprospiraceae bacterium]|nr:hypothetical protein [Saprospiraceae bacterium]
MNLGPYTPAIRHGIAIFIGAIFCLIYFYPSSFQNKTLTQSDVIQATCKQAEVRKFNEQENRQVLWTNSLFSGMPTFLVYGRWGNNYNLLGQVTSGITRLFGSVRKPYGLLFSAWLGCYVLLLVLKLPWYLCFIGATVFSIGTSHIHLIDGGHLNKLLTVSYLCPTLAGILLILDKKYLIGGALTALFICMQINANHIQITYYFFLLSILLLASVTYKYYREKDLKHLGKSVLILGISALIGVLPNITQLWTVYEYSSESIRGRSELTTTNKPTEGLDKGYAFDWSMGKLETFSLLAPNFMGGTSEEFFIQDRNSSTTRALSSVPVDPNQLARFTTKYWGAQPFTSGAYYYGAVLVLLFLVSLFLVSKTMQVWAVASMILIIALGWGENLSIINYWLFDNLPMFNKFRAVTMIYTLGHIPIVIVGMLGLRKLIDGSVTFEEKKKALLRGGGIMLGLIGVMLLIGAAGNLNGPSDSVFAETPQVLAGLREDRASLLFADTFRSLFYVLVAAGVLWAFLKKWISSSFGLALFALVALIDIWTINARYLSPSDFVDRSRVNQIVQPRPVDNQILSDQTLSYRVFDLTQSNPYASAIPSCFHQNIGGYHAAKLKIYQELIEQYLTNPTANPHILNMLNMRYLIRSGQDGGPVPTINNEALGNAWFVQNLQIVANADEEMRSIGSFDPSQTAIIQEKHAVSLEPSYQVGSADFIRLTNYVPDHLTYEYSASNDQLAVFSEVYYPQKKGWNLYVDGQKISGPVKANYILRAAELPAGQHKLEMIFEPNSFYQGNTYSRIGSLLLLFWFVGGMYKDRAALQRGAIYEPDIQSSNAKGKAKPRSKKVVQKKKKAKK